MRILISNDDGAHAPGIEALAKAFKKWGPVTVVAPEREKSTTGHSLTLHKPLRLEKLPNGFYRCNGGPADCVYLGANEVMKQRPDIVITGINRGPNLGQDVFYSGTVAGAREASNMRIPSMAVSLAMDFFHKTGKLHYDAAARAAEVALDRALTIFAGGKKNRALGLKNWPKGMLLNVNVPNLPYGKLKGFRVGHQGHRYYSGKILRRIDARGRTYYWIGGVYEGYEPMPASDCAFVDKGFVAVTPLELDTTERESYQFLKESFR